jgi:hypothetical protein
MQFTTRRGMYLPTEHAHVMHGDARRLQTEGYENNSQYTIS